MNYEALMIQWYISLSPNWPLPKLWPGPATDIAPCQGCSLTISVSPLCIPWLGWSVQGCAGRKLNTGSFHPFWCYIFSVAFLMWWFWWLNIKPFHGSDLWDWEFHIFRFRFCLTVLDRYAYFCNSRIVTSDEFFISMLVLNLFRLCNFTKNVILKMILRLTRNTWNCPSTLQFESVLMLFKLGYLCFSQIFCTKRKAYLPDLRDLITLCLMTLYMVGRPA